MSGILGKSNPAATTLTTVYTVPAGKTAVFNASIANTSAFPLVLRLAVSTTGTPTTSEYLEYDTVLVGNGVLERGGIVAGENSQVVVYVSTANAAVTLYGYEE